MTRNSHTFATQLMAAVAAIVLATTSFAAIVSVPSAPADQIAATPLPELA